MNNEFIYILKIIYYFVFVFAVYLFALTSYNSKKNKKQTEKKKKHRISTIIIIILCFVIGYYSIICGPNPPKLDRLNYAFRFMHESQALIVKQSSLGLYFIECFLHLFTYNPDILFFTMAFIYYYLSFKAYDTYEEVYPIALLFLTLSSYGLFGFYMLKQCIAIALVAIAFACLFKNQRKTCIVLTALAITFHESAWIVIPIYFALIFSKSKTSRFLSYSILLICVIFFRQISTILVNLFSFIPGISDQIVSYIDEKGGIVAEENYFTILKGLPYYFITIFAFVKRNVLKDKIKNYDKFLMISFFCSIATLLSFYMYWMWRFAAYCYFPVVVFASIIYSRLTKSKEKMMFASFIVLTLGALMVKLLIQYYYIYGGIV